MVKFNDIRVVNIALAELITSEVIEYDEEYKKVYKTLCNVYDGVINYFGKGVNEALENRLLKRISEIAKEATLKGVPYE